MNTPFPPEVCSVCKDPHHTMSLEKRREIAEMRVRFPERPSPLYPEEYHTGQRVAIQESAKNVHPNRTWRKTWRMQPEQCRDIDWPQTIRDYIQARGWTLMMLAARLGIEHYEALGWYEGSDTPPPYLMLALSALE